MTDKACGVCGGLGAVPVKRTTDFGPPVMERCQCRLKEDILKNVERGMPGLTAAPPIQSSPLSNLITGDLRLTATRNWFMTHLRHVAVRQHPSWSFFVVTDAQLMTAWLANQAVKGAEIFDADAMTITASHYSLEDLSVPPALLIVYLGVKAARNVAMPEVLLEALSLRQHEGKPSWVVDQYSYPLDHAHISYSPAVGDFVSRWPHLSPKDEGLRMPGPMTLPGQPERSSYSPTPSAASARYGGGATGQTRAVAIEEIGSDAPSYKTRGPKRGKK